MQRTGAGERSAAPKDSIMIVLATAGSGAAIARRLVAEAQNPILGPRRLRQGVDAERVVEPPFPLFQWRAF
jgi:hypothetical protein